MLYWSEKADDCNKQPQVSVAYRSVKMISPLGKSSTRNLAQVAHLLLLLHEEVCRIPPLREPPGHFRGLSGLSAVSRARSDKVRTSFKLQVTSFKLLGTGIHDVLSNHVIHD